MSDTYHPRAAPVGPASCPACGSAVLLLRTAVPYERLVVDHAESPEGTVRVLAGWAHKRYADPVRLDGHGHRPHAETCPGR